MHGKHIYVLLSTVLCLHQVSGRVACNSASVTNVADGARAQPCSWSEGDANLYPRAGESDLDEDCDEEELKALTDADNSVDEGSGPQGEDGIDIDTIEKATPECLQRVSKALEPVRAKFKGKEGNQPGLIPEMKQALCNAAPVQPQDAQRCSQRVDELFASVRNQNEAGAVVQFLNKEDTEKFSKAPEKFDKDVCARHGGVYDFTGSEGNPGPAPGPAGSTPPKEGKQPSDSGKDKDKNKDKEVAPAPGGGDSGSSVATTVLGGLFGTALTAAGGTGLYLFSHSAAGAGLLTSLGTALGISAEAGAAEAVTAAVSRFASRLGTQLAQIVQRAVARVGHRVVRPLLRKFSSDAMSETTRLITGHLKTL